MHKPLKQQDDTVFLEELRPGTKEILAKQEILTFEACVSLFCFLQVLESFSDKTPPDTTQLEVIPDPLWLGGTWYVPGKHLLGLVENLAMYLMVFPLSPKLQETRLPGDHKREITWKHWGVKISM